MLLKSNRAKVIGLFIGFILLLLCISASIVYGYTNTSWKMALEAFSNFNNSNEHIIIQSIRLPRALIAATVGASLAISGALMQALTKNPLADPGIFGVNAGAGFFIVIAMSIFSISSMQAFTWIAFIGAAITSFTVYFIGSLGREGLTPMKLTLAGAAMAAMFSSFTQGILVMDEMALDQVLFWLAGSIRGRDLEFLITAIPYIVLAWVIAFSLSKKINILTMGEDVAKGLGQRTGTVKLLTALVIILLAGGSVAIAGPIGFIGIVIPHIARFIVGTDYRWVLPFSAILGGVLLLLADISARYIAMPEEVPVGVMTAIIGTPFFIYIARKGFQKS